MATITIEVTDLVQAITEYQDEQGLSDRELGLALGVSKNSPHNWRTGREMNLTPALQRRVASELNLPCTVVLAMAGYDVSDEVPATVGGKGAELISGRFVFTDDDLDNVIDLDAHGDVLLFPTRIDHGPDPATGQRDVA